MNLVLYAGVINVVLTAELVTGTWSHSGTFASATAFTVSRSDLNVMSPWIAHAAAANQSDSRRARQSYTTAG